MTLGGQFERSDSDRGGGHSTFALKNDGTVVAWGLTAVSACGFERGDGDCGGSCSHRSLEERWHGGGVGEQCLWRDRCASRVEWSDGDCRGTGHTVALLGTAVTLQARRSGNTLVLSWPASATGFTLQSTLSLTPPVTWINSIYPPVLIGKQFIVTNNNSGSVQFYRLRKP